ncbi:MAG: hypothetical protein H0W44_07495 [Gammaproteobacteria bacterium]|nr:hypothetical protein [Gammaproteobacteria bacterium]
MSELQGFDDLKLDGDNLYREEVYTDRKLGTLRCMIPITITGATDAARQSLYIGQTQLMTAMGALPIAAEIEADSLAHAVAQFPAAMKKAVQDTIEEMNEMRRQASSQIVVPGMEGGRGGFGGMPGGGKIQIP